MIVRIKRVVRPDSDDVTVVGYSDQIPELGHAMHIWWEEAGVVFHFRSGTVSSMEDASGTGYKAWLVATDTGIVYNVLILSQRMVDEIGIKGVMG